MPTNPDALDTVGIEDLEKELARVRAGTADPVAGIFGPRSLTWQIDREAAVFLGAGRALLLQLAHPWVAAAIEQHSHAFADPVGRFHRTPMSAINTAWRAGSSPRSLGYPKLVSLRTGPPSRPMSTPWCTPIR
jgi:hypothetical protein